MPRKEKSLPIERSKKHLSQPFHKQLFTSIITLKLERTQKVSYYQSMRITYLPNIIAVSAVVPEEREDSREHDFAKAASVSMNDLATTFSSSKGKPASSTITLGKLSRTNFAAKLPSCPSNTYYQNQVPLTLKC